MGVLFAALLVLGTVAYERLPVQLVPTGYDLPFFYVSIPTLPSNPKDIEDQVAVPVEEMLSTVRNIKRMRTTVRSTDVGIYLAFEDGTDMTEAYNQVHDRLERVLPSLPEDVSRYLIWKYDPTDQPIYWFGVSLPPERAGGAEDSTSYLEEHISRPLERLDGVSRIQVLGASERRVQIRLDEERIQSAGLTAFDIMRDLREDNFILAAGTLEDEGQRFPLRVQARFSDLNALKARPLSSGHRLSDVADIEVLSIAPRDLSRINGQDAVIFGVFKEADANTVQTCNAIRARLLELFEGEKLTMLAFHDFANQGDLIQESIDNLQETLLFGGVFAIIVLLAFIHRLRMTLLIACAIPVSMLVTLVVMYFTHFSLNILTLMGLMLSVGMVVDNSVVVVENIQRFRYDGATPYRAALEGTAEVALALFVATATTVVVFLPMILMSSNQSLSFYLGKIGFPVCISLIASLIVSLLFIPVASLLVLAKDPGKEKPSRVIQALEDGYRKSLSWIVHHRFDAFVVFALVTSSILIPMDEVKRTDAVRGNINDVRIRFDLPPAMTPEERKAYFQEVEQAILPLFPKIGAESLLIRMRGSGNPRVQIFLADLDEKPDREMITDTLINALPVYPGVSARIGWTQQARGSDSEATITLKLRGPDSVKLAELSEEVVRRVESLPEVSSVEADLEETSANEMHFIIDQEAAQLQGLSALSIGSSIDYTLRGRRLSDFHFERGTLEMWAEGDAAARNDLERLREVRVPSLIGGRRVAIHQVAEAKTAVGYGSIKRENRETVLDINVHTHEDDLETLEERINTVLKGFSLPRGYSLAPGDRIKNLKQEDEEQAFALWLATICVFLLMGVLFESMLMPLAIIFSIPFAFLGVYWALYLTDTPLDVMGGVGLIILIGIVVNNGIVLIDTVNQRRKEGMNTRDAIVAGASRRLRPVLMTALTTIFGLVPMAVGDAGVVGIPYAPLGRVVIGGLVASTLLTLFVVPYLYLLLDHARNAVLALGSGLFRRRQRAPHP